MNQKLIYASISVAIGAAILLSVTAYVEGKLLKIYKYENSSCQKYSDIHHSMQLQNYILIVANSVDRYRRDVYDDASRQFDKTRRNIEDGLGMDDMCVVDGDCPGNPITECDHEGSMMNTAVGKCRFVWWFYLILILVALAIIGCMLSCVCMPCCCLYECLRKLCCCCC